MVSNTSLGELVWRAPEPADAEALGLMHYRSWVDSYSDLAPPGWFDDHGPQERVEGAAQVGDLGLEGGERDRLVAVDQGVQLLQGESQRVQGEQRQYDDDEGQGEAHPDQDAAPPSWGAVEVLRDVRHAAHALRAVPRAGGRPSTSRAIRWRP